jgi:hypothetical protein
MNDDSEWWMKIYSMLSVTIPKLDIIQQVSFNYYTSTMIQTLHSILNLMRLRPWDSSIRGTFEAEDLIKYFMKLHYNCQNANNPNNANSAPLSESALDWRKPEGEDVVCGC